MDSTLTWLCGLKLYLLSLSIVKKKEVQQTKAVLVSANRF